jgi:hypothetical protein
LSEHETGRQWRELLPAIYDILLHQILSRCCRHLLKNGSFCVIF